MAHHVLPHVRVVPLEHVGRVGVRNRAVLEGRLHGERVLQLWGEDVFDQTLTHSFPPFQHVLSERLRLSA